MSRWRTIHFPNLFRYDAAVVKHDGNASAVSADRARFFGILADFKFLKDPED
jgi:hypothetical protein